MTMLRDIAHVRSGDKGDTAQLSVIACRAEHYGLLADALTPARVARHLSRLPPATTIRRIEAPTLGALVFVLAGALDGGVTRSLALDAHGKTLAMQLLDIDLVQGDRARSITGGTT